MNNKVKTVFFDLDHTLLHPQTGKPQLEVLQSAARLKNQGYKVGIASGKTLHAVKQIDGLDMIQWDGYVLCGGAKVYDQNFQLLSDRSLTKFQMRALLKTLRRNGIPAYCDGQHSFLTEMNDQTGQFLDEYDLYPTPVLTYAGQSIEQVIVPGSHADSLSRMLKQIWGIHLIPAGHSSIQVRRKGVDKASGIHVLMNAWNLSETAYMCFGDGHSDVSMITDAAIGCALNDADHDVIQAADWICDNAGSSSIPNALQALLAI